MFKKILIANRGEIACRVAATARRMGIATVAVYSEADRLARHVQACDEAVYLGPAAAKESYLCADKIIAAARATGAEAIHPGYGFLSENEAFAEACAAAGLAFIGPPAAAISAMGSKSAAKALMERAGVPLVPGYHGDEQDAEFLQQQADAIGYPVLLKASAGGGGKGMRVVERSADFKEALASCKREAINAFGDDKVLLEKYLLRPRHIEIQVFADTHGQCVYLFERDCSVQRRHQKVLEEAPAPGMSAARRGAMGEAAVAAAQAVGYVGAGTVEFIAQQDGTFYFMEMNTRLQVEHPVTEMITATDLVEWQLRVAAGEPLPCTQAELRVQGHAIEARIYAENPEKGFLPSTGRILHLATPPAVHFCTGMTAAHGTPAAVRIDSGVQQGDSISPFYDPMIAKLIVWGADRAEALARMAQALAAYQVVGLSTNVAFLKRLVEGRAFATAELDTGLIEREHASLFPPQRDVPRAACALATAARLLREAAPAGSDPWSQRDGWRLATRWQRQISWQDDVKTYTCDLLYAASGWLLQEAQTRTLLAVLHAAGTQYRIQLGEEVYAGSVVCAGEETHVFHDGQHHLLRALDPLAHAGETESEGGRLTAPMPGKIVALLVKPGQQVGKGEALLIMEAMKMEHTIAAPHSGTVREMLYAVGEQVGDGVELLVFEAESNAA